MKQLIYIALIVTFITGAWLVISHDLWGFSTWAGKEYMPRRACMYGEDTLIKTHLWADWAISISYTTLPVWLIYLIIKRRDFFHKATIIVFAAFILFCGGTHIMNIIAMYHTYYRWDAIVKVCCAIASIGAAVTFPFVVRQVIKMPSSKAFEEMIEQLKKTQRELGNLKEIAKKL